jgi:FkbM family methyltransferase
MNGREIAKSAIRAAGIFPFARLAYRRLVPKMQRQRLHEINFYREILQPGDMCFDIGANLGQKTEVMLAAGASRVILLEPNANCYSDLNFQYSRNPNVIMVQSAVGSKEGTVKLFVNGSGAAASVLPDWNQKIFGKDFATTPMEVPITSLDNLIGEYGRPNYIKLDIEGFEEEAIRGLTSQVPVISFEFFHENQSQTFNCLAMLAALGRIQIRYCDMDCNWLSDPTNDISKALLDIQQRRLDGDMFVWTG